MKPELLAVRAVNEYRSYNKLAYLGLRYYLENQSARSNRWIEDVATRLVMTRTTPNYFPYIHFKSIYDNNITHRDIHIPSPNEALAEAALINKCSKYEAFQSLPCVYSYRFPEEKSKEGIFQKYFTGLKERHKSITYFCENSTDGFVKYTDIKRFYPNITKELALKVWRETCDKSSIENKYRELGEKILESHAQVSIKNDDKGLLTGPMISHLIANLLLKDVDRVMSEKMPNRYWRYVDDITIAGNKEEITENREFLEKLIEQKGLLLHTGDKDFTILGSDWLKGQDDFEITESSQLWMFFIGNIKRFLYLYPEKQEHLKLAFIENDININLLSYTGAIQERSYYDKLKDFMSYGKWAEKILKSLSIPSLLKEAFIIRKSLQDELEKFFSCIDSIPKDNNYNYERKRFVSKVRYCVGRLSYVSPPDLLVSLSDKLSLYPELHMLSIALKSVSSRDVSNLISLGNNAVQAAAQILRLKNIPVECSLDTVDKTDDKIVTMYQGIAILQLNGIKIRNRIEPKYPINHFALEDNMQSLMKSEDLFIRELASLHGVDKDKRHIHLFDSAFDKDDDLSFDLITLDRYGGSLPL